MPATSEAVFNEADLHERIQEAISEDGNDMLELRIAAQPGASAIEASIPAASVREMADAGLTALFISTPLGTLIYDREALQSMYSQGAGEIFTFSIGLVDPETLDENLRDAVGDWILYKVQVRRGSGLITGFGAGRVTIRLFYRLRDGQSALGLMVRRLDENAETTDVESRYNAAGAYIEFTRDSHSWYMVGYDADTAAAAVAALAAENPFTDVSEGDWFHDPVRFIYGRRLMIGTSADRFSPGESLTRGMMVATLHRMAGSPDTEGLTNPFSDIAEDAWYAETVKWASANGIAAGYSESIFGPEDRVTREQLAVLLLNYEEYSGRIPPDILMDREFSDWGEISDWAKNAVNRLTIQGLIAGKPGNLFDPGAGATRAEAAAILQRFIVSVER